MNAEDLFVNDRGKRQVVENVGAVSPDVNRAVFSESLVVESIYLGNLPTLVVASN
eukprot:CAMPEP_0168340200 /NCGR_PEP_ID=MMETSP0213-20121227/13919_1 /TAXON_ID=151035 /ORGANISM="Euplotes harpa, Strain FSP1.4" /LENGTH=54 /DNA_ID=CAMNT_0008346385 /DNA_START=467 /DNA_END=631 /DNA_ORIENTATION=-